MDRSIARRWTVLASRALMLALAASVADAVLGNRAGSQVIAWALGATVGLMIARGALARLRVSDVAPGFTSAP